MKWHEYYARYDNWESGAQYGWVSAITDFGPETSPSSQIVDCIRYVEERTANKIIHRALAAGVRFSNEEVFEIIDGFALGDEAVSELIGSTDESTYSAAQLEEMLSILGDETPVLQLIDRICQKPNYFVDTELVSLIESLCDEERSKKLLLMNKTSFSEEALAALCDQWVDEEVIRTVARRSGIPYSSEDDVMDDNEFGESRGGGLGLLGALAVGAVLLGDDNDGHSDDSCEDRSPHYGYRYGRWYYGNGHQRGCERGGNGGASGRNGRD